VRSDAVSGAFGPAIRWTYADGPSLDLAHEHAYRQALADAGCAFETKIHGIGSKERGRTFLFTMAGGLSSLAASVGLGDIPHGDAQGEAERRAAAARYGYAALGWYLGTGVDLHFASRAASPTALVGIGPDLHDLYGVRTSERHSFLLAGSVGVGLDVPFPQSGQ
jgi:hypothetical protein